MIIVSVMLFIRGENNELQICQNAIPIKLKIVFNVHIVMKLYNCTAHT